MAIEARSLAPKPATVDFTEAAAIPQAGLTSWQALFDHGHLESGQTVVIHGAGSGVGAVGVQLARWAGAHVIGTGRASARQRALDFGADEFVDLEQDGWEKAAGQVDLVYDAIGGDVLARSPAIVKPGGAVVSVMAPPQTDRDDIRAVHFVRDANGAQLREITPARRRGHRAAASRRGLPARGGTRGLHGQVGPAHSRQGRAGDLTT